MRSTPTGGLRTEIGELFRFGEQRGDLERVIVEVFAINVGEQSDGESRFWYEHDDGSPAHGAAALDEPAPSRAIHPDLPAESATGRGSPPDDPRTGGSPGPARSARAITRGPGRGEPSPNYFEAISASLNRGWAPLSGVVEGPWKLVHLPIPELYDLANDPGEATNLFESRRDVARRLEKLLPAPKSPGTSGPSAPGGEEARRLLSLGYLSGSARPAAAWTHENDPKSLVGLDAKIHRAIALYQGGRAGEAAAAAAAIVRERPAMAVGYELLSFLLDETGRRGEAVETLLRARRLGLASEPMQVRLALLLSEEGRPSEALGVLTPLSGSEDPGHPQRDRDRARRRGAARGGPRRFRRHRRA